MCECDLEQPRLYRETHRKARKQYKCCECGTLINFGDIYADIFGVWDEPKAFKQCVECNKIGSKLAQWNECGYPLGRLYQELIDSEILDCNENKEWKSLTNWVEISNQKPLKCVLIEVQNG